MCGEKLEELCEGLEAHASGLSPPPVLPRLSSGKSPAVGEEGKWRRKESGKLEDKGKMVCVCGGNAAGGEQRLEGAAQKLRAQGSGSVVLHVRVNLEDVPGLIPRQQLCASGAETERSWKGFASLFYPYINQR